MRYKDAYKEITQVNERPADLLSHSGDGIDDDLSGNDENRMDDPSTCRSNSEL